MRRTYLDRTRKLSLAFLASSATVFGFVGFDSVVAQESDDQAVIGLLEPATVPSGTNNQSAWQHPTTWSAPPLQPPKKSQGNPNSLNGSSNVWQSENLGPVPMLMQPEPDLNSAQFQQLNPPTQLSFPDDPFEIQPPLPQVASELTPGPNEFPPSWQEVFQPAPLLAPQPQIPQSQPLPQQWPDNTEVDSLDLPSQFPLPPVPAETNAPAALGASAKASQQIGEPSLVDFSDSMSETSDLGPAPAEIKSEIPGWFDSSPIRIRFQAEAVYLRHSGGDDAPFILDPDTNETLFTHSDVDPGSKFGGRYSFLYQSEGGTGFEFSYMQIDEFSGQTTFPVGTPLIFGAVPPTPVPPYTSSYDSKLKNVEINAFVRKRKWLRLGGGFRMIDLEESFDTVRSGSTFGFFSDTGNSLYGGQLTADVYKQLGRSTNLELGSKFGVYQNNIDVSYLSTNRNLNYEDEVFSSSIDFNVGLAIQMTKGMLFRFGYQKMIVSDAALAPDQSTGFNFGDTSAPANLSKVDFEGLYFGAKVWF